MSPSSLFERLGAPLNNIQWSWGAQRSDGTIFLRVWQDETRKLEGGRRVVRLVNHEAYRGPEINHGYDERRKHLAALLAGAVGYAVICRAEDVHARPRTIASFEERDVMRLGEILMIEGDEWGELVDRVSVRSLQP